VPTSAEALFAPSETPRTPQEWARLLAEATARPPAPQSGGARPRPAPVARRQPEHTGTPLPESTRRFLRPLVGIVPDDVRVHRGAHAAQVTHEQAADAVTAGQDIFLAPGHDDDSPEALGVLAHELTHVARQQTPRFVPPLVEQRHSQADDEEHVARSVEARVAERASTPQEPAAPPATLPKQPHHSDEADAEAADEPSSPASPDDRAFWGDLPAPWEPLPAWMEQPAAPAPQAASAENTSAAGAATPAAPAVQRAEVGRALEGVDDAAAAASSVMDAAGESDEGEEGDEGEEPDMDALAKQVYAILKRRLAAERRRNSFY
jgi:hypothetical protein